MDSSTGWFLRALASLLVRGPHAPFVLGDMEEALRRDVARGMSLHRARLRFVVNAVASWLSLMRASLRMPGWPWRGPAWIDVKLGWRMLRKNPLLSAVALLSLAIGIPVGMMPVHVMDALDAVPPVEDGNRLTGLRFWGTGGGGAGTTTYDLALWQETLTSFEGLAAFREVERNLAAAGDVGAPVAAAEVTSSAFSLLRVRPLLGRPLQAADEAPGAAHVVVLGFDLWQSRFAASPEAVGSTVRIGGVPHVVVGVMPEGFHFPIRHRMWLPLRAGPAREPGQGPRLSVFGRLAEDVNPAAAQAELTAVHGRMAAQFPEVYGRITAEVVPLTTLLSGFPRGGAGAIGGIGPFSTVVVFQTLALLLLMVACANVGLLIFARTAARSAELAMRAALGASRSRIVVQVATEAFVLALVAASAGLLLMAWLPNRVLVALWSPQWGGVPWWIDLGLTPITAVRALLLAAFSATAAAVVPTLRVTGKAVRHHVQRAGSGGYGLRFGGVWSALVVADVAFAIAAVGLVIGVGARMEPIASGQSIGGFAAEEYLSVRLELPATDQGVPTDSSEAAARSALLAATQRRLVERLEAEPGVRGVTVADRLPRMDHGTGRVEVEGGLVEGVERAYVDPGFFEVLEWPVLAGRSFHRGDLAGERPAVIVNSSFAQELLGRANPVGRRVRYLSWDGEPGPWYEIVGMVGDLGMDPLQPENAAGIYHPVAPGDIPAPYLAVHVSTDPAAFAPRLREIAAEVDPTAIIRATPLADVYPDDWYVSVGFAAAWTVFVVVLLALAASGIYATMAFAVTQRTREIGIRSALGARASDIVSSIGRRAAIQLGTGAMLGMPVAGFIYFQMRHDAAARLDAFVVAVVPGFLILFLVALLACTGPLLRALRIAPTEAMKA